MRAHMPSMLPLLVLLAGSADTTAQQPRTDAAQRLEWLSGCWAGSMPGGLFYEETWLPPRANSLFGVSRTTRDGRVTGHEFLRIVQEQDALVYLAHPSGQQPARFPLTESSDTMVVFANPQHDFPQVIRYRRRGADSLHARVEGPARSGGTRAIDFPMARVRCEAEPR